MDFSKLKHRLDVQKIHIEKIKSDCQSEMLTLDPESDTYRLHSNKCINFDNVLASIQTSLDAIISFEALSQEDMTTLENAYNLVEKKIPQQLFNNIVLYRHAEIIPQFSSVMDNPDAINDIKNIIRRERRYAIQTQHI